MVGTFLILMIPSAVVSLVVGYMAFAGSRETLERNAIYGIRTRSTSRSDAAWVAAHKAAAKYNYGAAAAFLASGVISYFGQTETQMAALLLLGWLVAFVVMAMAVRVAVSAAAEASRWEAVMVDEEQVESDGSGE